MTIVSRVRNHKAKWYTVSVYHQQSEIDSGLPPTVNAKFTHEGDAQYWAQHLDVLLIYRIIIS